MQAQSSDRNFFVKIKNELDQLLDFNWFNWFLKKKKTLFETSSAVGNTGDVNKHHNNVTDKTFVLYFNYVS